MNAGIMNVHHNGPENFIDDPEDFTNIVSDSYVDMRATKYKKIPLKFSLNNWMEDQNPTCSLTSLCSLTSYL